MRSKQSWYVKRHFAMNTTQGVVVIEVSTDDAYGVKALYKLVEKAEGNVWVAGVIGD